MAVAAAVQHRTRLNMCSLSPPFVFVWETSRTSWVQEVMSSIMRDDHSPSSGHRRLDQFVNVHRKD
jgi:hypothetical protein